MKDSYFFTLNRLFKVNYSFIFYTNKNMKNVKIIGVFSTLIVASAIMLNLGQSFAATTTNTTLGITAGILSFYKDTGSDMLSYFGHAGNANDAIDIGTYGASLDAISAQSSGDHRFTVSDLKWTAFTITLQSSDLTALDVSGATLTIPKAGIGYTGTARMGTGKALTAAPTNAADIGTAPVTFVARSNHTGVSKFAQEITLKVAIPAAQTPGAYTGLLTFTY